MRGLSANPAGGAGRQAGPGPNRPNRADRGAGPGGAARRRQEADRQADRRHRDGREGDAAAERARRGAGASAGWTSRRSWQNSVDTAEKLRPQLAAVRSQIERLGPAPGKDAPPEAPAIAAERARLTALASELDGAIKSAELTWVRARQLIERITVLRHSLFTRNLLERLPSPLLPGVWRDFSNETPAVGRRLQLSVRRLVVLGGLQEARAGRARCRRAHRVLRAAPAGCPADRRPPCRTRGAADLLRAGLCRWPGWRRCAPCR